jgi:glutamate---cysteine ligase / carboxylate-amine ligase
VSASDSSMLHLFEGYGIEIEYMIVDRRSFDVRPYSDRVLEAAAGEVVSEVEVGELCWSNELMSHVIELKTNGPAPSLAGVADFFQRDVRRINGILAASDAILMPSAMHPWMDPDREALLWAHEYNEVYSTYDRIFDCRGHGWSNLQSMHINLPFAGDAEFARLHAAIRVLLPLLPALASSSPYALGRNTGFLDYRMEVYRHNARRVPSLSGDVVPEPVYSEQAYRSEIFERMYADIAPHDPEGVLRHEWLNSRGAIARFERDAIEIRVIDTQEAPVVDLAIAAAVAHLAQGFSSGELADFERQARLPVATLADVFQRSLRHAEQTPVEDADYLAVLGMPGARASVLEIWQALLERRPPALDAAARAALDHILRHGPLSRRMLAFAGAEPSRARLQALARELTLCLEQGRSFAA